MNKKIINILPQILIAIVLLACGMLFLSTDNSQIKRSWPLIIAFVFFLPKISSKNLFTIQKFIFIYLFLTLINLLSFQYFQFNIKESAITIPLSFFMVLVLGLSFILSLYMPGSTLEKKEVRILNIWAATVSILILFMFILFLMLKKYYGYGYEYNFNVTGKICLTVVCFAILWKLIVNIRFLQIYSAVLFIFFIIFTIKSF